VKSVKNAPLGFGMISMPVKLYSIQGDNEVKLHQIHPEDGGRISLHRVCKICGQTIEYDALGKAFEVGDRTVPLTDAELDALPTPAGAGIEILKFIPRNAVDPSWLEKPYYVAPDKGALKAYTLLRNAIAGSELAGLVRLAMRTKDSLAIVRASGNVLVLQMIAWADQVREPAFPVLDEPVDISEAEQAMADVLLSAMTGEWDPAEYRDEYRAALLTLAENKIAGTEPEAGEEPAPRAQVVDLTAALQASLAAVKAKEEAAA